MATQKIRYTEAKRARNVFQNTKDLFNKALVDWAFEDLSISVDKLYGLGQIGAIRYNEADKGLYSLYSETPPPNYAIQIGYKSGTGSENAIAIGQSARAADPNAISLGHGATTKNDGAVAIGYNASTQGMCSLGIGDYAQTTLAGSMCLSSNRYTYATQVFGMAIGAYAYSYYSNPGDGGSVAIG